MYLSVNIILIILAYQCLTIWSLEISELTKNIVSNNAGKLSFLKILLFTICIFWLCTIWWFLKFKLVVIINYIYDISGKVLFYYLFIGLIYWY